MDDAEELQLTERSPLLRNNDANSRISTHVQEQSGKSMPTFGDLFKHVSKQNKWRLLMAVVCAVISSILYIYAFFAMMPIVSAMLYYEEAERDWLSMNKSANLTELGQEMTAFSIKITGTVVCLMAVVFVLKATTMYLFGTVTVSIIKRLRRKYINKLLGLDMARSQRNTSQDLAIMLQQNLSAITDAFENNIPIMLMQSLDLICALILAHIVRWDVALFTAAMTLPTVFLYIFGTKHALRLISMENHYICRASQIATECFQSIKTVICFNGQRQTINRYEMNINNAMYYSHKRAVSNSIIDSIKALSIEMAKVSGMTYGLLKLGDYDPGLTMAVVFSLILIYSSVAPLLNVHISVILGAVNGAHEINEMLNIPSEIEHKKGKSLGTIGPEIDFQNVSFSYASRENITVVNELSLHISPGDKVAIVGPSGSGKSTIAALLLGFYKPTTGNIILDGEPLEDLDIGWLRQQFGFVSQEPLLFNMSIRENIKCVKQEATEAQIIQVLRLANAYDFVMQMPEGMDTCVGEGGVQLSGGQKQRIAIARALIRKPAIMIFDESTSALDTHSEIAVMRAIDMVSSDCTTITIAHRLSTILNTDCVFVMENGSIKECDAPDNLIKKKGLFSKMLEGMSSPLWVYKYIFGLVEGSELLWLLILLCSICRAAKYISLYLTIALVMDTYSYTCLEDIMTRVKRALILFIVGQFIGVIGEIGMNIPMPSYSDKLTSKIRISMLTHYLSQNMAYFDNHDSSTISATLSTHPANIRETISSKGPQAFTAAVTLVAGFVTSLCIDPYMTLISISLWSFTTALQAIQMKNLTTESKNLGHLQDKASEHVSEALRNLETVKAYSLEQFFSDLHDSDCLKAEKTKIQALFLKACMTANTITFLLISLVVTDLGATYLMRYTTSTVFSFTVAQMLTNLSLNQVLLALSQNQVFARTMASFETVSHVLNESTGINYLATAGVTPDISGDIEMKNVRFHYPSRPEAAVLTNFDMHIHAGSSVAIVGASGCGKSTIMSLILRLYEHSNGSVTLDGLETSLINPTHLHNQIVTVSQEPVLFSGTIWDNISYGMDQEQIKPDQVFSAARSANIHNFIQSLPEKYGTQVGSFGTELSGGQKQRIAIARALIRHAPILLLDEATAALDTENEKAIPQAMALLRTAQGGTVPEVQRFLCDLLKLNDNSKNRYIDDHYRAAMLTAVSQAIAPNPNPERSIQEPDSLTVDVRSALDELLLALNLEKLRPSYCRVISVHCVRGIYSLLRKGHLPLNVDWLWHFAKVGIFYKVRMVAVDCLVDFAGGFKDRETLQRLISMCSTEIDPGVKYHLAKALALRPPFAARNTEVAAMHPLNTTQIHEQLVKTIVGTHDDPRLRCALLDLYFVMYGQGIPSCLNKMNAFSGLQPRPPVSQAMPINLLQTSNDPLEETRMQAGGFLNLSLSNDEDDL